MKQPEDGSRPCFLKESSTLGLAVALSPGTMAEAFADSKSKPTQEEDTMTQTTATHEAASRQLTRPLFVCFM
jgi:hypothetical protein